MQQVVVISKGENKGVPIEVVKEYVKPSVWEKLNTHKDYSHVESICFCFNVNDEGDLSREVVFNYLRGTIGTRLKESHLQINYDELMKSYLKATHIRSFDKITEKDLFDYYCAYGEMKNRNPLSTKVVSMELNLMGKNNIKIELGIPRGRSNRVIEVTNSKFL
jgi:hypothetical protein